MKRVIPFLFLILAARLFADQSTDLGYNLSYLRVHSLAEATTELQSALAVKHACVLDLRYSTASEESLGAFKTALAGHPSDSPLFVLVSPDTPAGLLEIINPATKPKAITLGIAGSEPAPKIIVKTDAQADRRAYDAFDKGTPLTELISGKIDKDRYDEATLVHEFKNGNTEAEPPLTPDPTKSKGTEVANKTSEATADTPEPLKDRVLQRALNLHQALLALRR